MILKRFTIHIIKLKKKKSEKIKINISHIQSPYKRVEKKNHFFLFNKCILTELYRFYDDLKTTLCLIKKNVFVSDNFMF